MANDPAFLFYPNDYIGGTMGMSFEEKGAFIELLMCQFNRGHMTAHMCGQLVGQLWDKVKHKFEQDDNGLFFNKRLEYEINKRKSYTDSRKNNIKGINQYTNKDAHMIGHMTTHMENENVNENINKEKSKKEKEIIKKIEVVEKVLLTVDEINKLKVKHGDEGYEWMINKLSNYKISSGKIYKSDYAAILTWVVKEFDNEKHNKQYSNPFRKVKTNWI